MSTLLFIGGLGPVELGLVVLVLILLFGASKLPKLARSVGSATGEFKKGRQEVEAELEEMTAAEREAAEAEAEAGSSTGPASGTGTDAPAETGSEPEPDADRSNA